MSSPARRTRSSSWQQVESLEGRTLLTARPLDLIAPQWFEQVAADAHAATASRAATQMPVQRISWNGQVANTRTDEWIVQIDDRSALRLGSVAEAAGLLPQSGPGFQVIQGLGQVGQFVIRTPGASAEAVKNWLRSDPDVAYFAPNRLLSLDRAPNDSSYGELWGLNNTGQNWGTQGADIHAEEAWDLTTGSLQNVVGVIDTGIDYNHPDLYGNVWINQAEIPSDRRARLTDTDGDGLISFYDLNSSTNQGPYKITDLNGDGCITGADILAPWCADGTGGWADGASQDGDTFVDDLVGWNFVTDSHDPYDDQSHGTHVSGTIAGMGNNSDGVAGVNWRASIMGLRFLTAEGSGTYADAVRAINYTTMKHQAGVNIDLTSNSWGGTGYDQALYDAIRANGEAGMLFIAAAGNDGADNDVDPHYPAAFDLDNIVSVAAADSSDGYAYFSNYGATTSTWPPPATGSTAPSRTSMGSGSITPPTAGPAWRLPTSPAWPPWPGPSPPAPPPPRSSPH